MARYDRPQERGGGKPRHTARSGRCGRRRTGVLAVWPLVTTVLAAALAATGCIDEPSVAARTGTPPVRIAAERIGRGPFTPSGLPGSLGVAVDALSETILASWWGLSAGPRDAGIVCHERSLTEAQARLLAGNRVTLFLPALRELRPGVARVLATCTGHVDFGALESLDPAAAAALAGPRDRLVFAALRHVDAATARGLADCTGPLKLDALARLEPGVAEALAGHRGLLSLSALADLSADDARWLARHDGDLCLNGLRALTADVAAAFADFPHGLHLNSVETISTEVAAALAAHPGWWLGCDGLVAIDESALAILATHARCGPAIAFRFGLGRCAPP
jgi:hypothetical protein